MMRLALALLAVSCVESTVTQWEAAHRIAAARCETAACSALLVRGWCANASECSATVDAERLDRCVDETNATCWGLFR